MRRVRDRTDDDFPVWVWFSFAIVPRHVALSLRLLHRHAAAANGTVHLLNQTTLPAHLPDVPAEYWRIGSEAALSDLARTGLLARHGGLWVDADILVARPLGWVRDALRGSFRGVTYTSKTIFARKSSCASEFASNFFAARRGEPLWTQSWAEVKETLGGRCPAAGSHLPPRACCYDNASGVALPQCQVRYGGLGEAISHAVGARLGAAATRLLCLQGSQSFAPTAGHAVGIFNTYEQRLGGCAHSHRRGGRVNISYVSPPARRFEPLPFHISACCHRDADDLVCSGGPQARPPHEGRGVGFFARHAYHLFSSVHGRPLTPSWRRGANGSLACLQRFRDTCAFEEMGAELETGPWVLSELFRIAAASQSTTTSLKSGTPFRIASSRSFESTSLKNQRHAL